MFIIFQIFVFIVNFWGRSHPNIKLGILLVFLAITFISIRELFILNTESLHASNVEIDLTLERRISQLVKAGKWEEAIAENNSNRTNNPNVLCDVAFAYRKCGNTKKAEEVYSEVVKLDPSNIQARYELAQLFEAQGKINPAIQEYRRILNFSESEPDVLLAYGALLVKICRYDLAIPILSKAYELYPPNDSQREMAGKLLQKAHSTPAGSGAR